MSYRHPASGKFISRNEYEALQGKAYQTPLDERVKLALANDPEGVSAMVNRIMEALREREAFERAKKPNGSHIALRKAFNAFAYNRRVAAFLLVIGANPQVMFNRSRQQGSRANLNGFMKVRKLIDYITGEEETFERVSLALFAATIIAANMGKGWIANPEQELILSSEKVESLPPAIRDAIRDYQHKYMSLTGDSRFQACQFRTTFNNMGIYHYMREDFDNSEYANGILVNMESPVVQFLNDRWNLERFTQ